MRRLSPFWISLLLLYLIHAAAALRAERVLWSDGAYYFSQMLQGETFVIGDSSRAGADVLMEWPLIAALKLGITNLAALKLAFGFPSYLFTPASLLLCLWMAGPNRAWLAWPLATFAAGSMNTELLVIHESRVALALFWPVLFGLLDATRRRATLLTSAALSLPFIASYESAILLGPLLMVAGFLRFRQETDTGPKALATVSLASGLLATLVAVLSVVKPTHPANLATFEKSWPVLVGEGGAGVSLSLVLLGVAGVAALPWLATRRWSRVLLLLVAAGLAFSGLSEALGHPTAIAVESQYRARILNVILPALAAALLLITRRIDATRESPARNVLGVLFAAQIVLQLQLTQQWTTYREVSREALSCVRGLIPVDTAIAERLRARNASPQWMRGWHHATLTFVDRPGPLRAVLSVWNGYTSWQPFDPRVGGSFPRLERFGIDDREYRGTMLRIGHRVGPTWEPETPCRAEAPERR
jgi:hypothetical protein